MAGLMILIIYNRAISQHNIRTLDSEIDKLANDGDDDI